MLKKLEKKKEKRKNYAFISSGVSGFSSEVSSVSPSTPVFLTKKVNTPEIKKNIEEIVLMGGGTFGNWTPTAEFNIWADPEAARKVFESGCLSVLKVESCCWDSGLLNYISEKIVQTVFYHTYG